MNMKRLFYLLIFLSCQTYAQSYKSIAQKVQLYSNANSAKVIADKIAVDFDDPEVQAKAAFIWVAKNIKYNFNAYRRGIRKSVGFRYRSEEERLQKLRAIKDSIVVKTLKERKAVCEGYAQTLAKILSELGIQNEVVKGYVRNSYMEIGAPLARPNHAWNAVFIKDKWMAIDATWAAGSVINGRWQPQFDTYYFKIPEKHFLKTHYPELSRWRMGSEMSKKEFYEQPIYTTEFLKTNLELIAPTNGLLKTTEGESLTLQVKNLLSFQTVLCGLSSYRFAQKPSVVYKNSVGYIKITPSKNCQKLFLVVDGDVYIEFRLI
ncbi:conserved exported hypothetical protein [Tenacibaculum litopenaei]|jgi:transglutaminase/protease-like cytokinesis protein 3